MTAVDKPARRLKGPFRTVTAFPGKYRRAPRKIGGPQMAVWTCARARGV